MTNKNKIAFDNWWACLLATEQEALDKAVAQRLFYAGYRYGTNASKRKFVFLIGRRRITVMASGREEAKRKAEQAFKKRIAAAGKSLPAAGWSVRIESEQAAAP